MTHLLLTDGGVRGAWFRADSPLALAAGLQDAWQRYCRAPDWHGGHPPTLGPQPRRRNRWNSACADCRGAVAARAGSLVRRDGRWHVVCLPCLDRINRHRAATVQDGVLDPARVKSLLLCADIARRDDAPTVFFPGSHGIPEPVRLTSPWLPDGGVWLWSRVLATLHQQAGLQQFLTGLRGLLAEPGLHSIPQPEDTP